MGAITPDVTSVVVNFGRGNDVRELRVVHRKFPNSGDRSFFVAAYSWAARQAADSAKRAILRYAARCCARYRDFSGLNVRAQVVAGKPSGLAQRFAAAGRRQDNRQYDKRLDRLWCNRAPARSKARA